MAKSTYPIFNHDPRIIEEGQAQAQQILILEAAQLREEVKRLRAGYAEACQAAYGEIVSDCGEVMAKAAYHAVKTVLRKALEKPDERTSR